jgi:hypothetical protein
MVIEGLTVPMPVPSPGISGGGIILSSFTNNHNLTIYIFHQIAHRLKWPFAEILNIPKFIVHKCIATQIAELKFSKQDHQVKPN